MRHAGMFGRRGVIVRPASTLATLSAMNSVTASVPAGVRWTPSDVTHSGWRALYLAQLAICSRPPYFNAFCRSSLLLSRNVWRSELYVGPT